eukprot:gene31294-62373_t
MDNVDQLGFFVVEDVCTGTEAALIRTRDPNIGSRRALGVGLDMSGSAVPPSFTAAIDPLIAAVQLLPKAGADQRSTNLYGAVRQLAVVVFTDGRDTASREDGAATAALADEFRKRNAYLRSVARDGNFYLAEDAADLGSVFRDVSKQLNIGMSQYFTGMCTPRRSGMHA